ncbi:hypothetical protein BGZ82_005639 [Podila clonocystis]|nr:hypothetical protein BGZ82_005639 [Podila clonocystis]
MDVDHFTNPSHSSPSHEDSANHIATQQQAISLVHVDPTSTPSSGSDQKASQPRISVSLQASSEDHSPDFVFPHSIELGTHQSHNSLSSDNSSEYESEDDFSSETQEGEEQEGEKEHSEDDDSLDVPLILQAGRMESHSSSKVHSSSKAPVPSPSLKSPVQSTLRHSPAFGYSRIPRKPIGVGYSPQHALNRLEVENAYLISQNTSINRDIQHCRNTIMALKQIVAQKEEIIEQMRHEHRQACLKAKFMESVLAEYHDARDNSRGPESTTHESYSRIQHKIHPVEKVGQGADDDDDDDDLSYSDMDNSEFESDEDDYDDQDDGDHESDYDGSDGGQPPNNSIHGDDHFVQIPLDDNPHLPSTSDTESERSVDSPQLRRRPRQILSSVIPFGSSSRIQSTFSGFTLAIPVPPASDAPESDLEDAHTGLRDGLFLTGVFNIGEDAPDETASETTLTPNTIKETDLELDMDVPQERSNGDDTFDPTTKNAPTPQPNSAGLYTKTSTPPSIYLTCVDIEATVSSGSLSAEHSPSSEGGSTLPDTSPDQDSKDHLSATSTMTTLPTDEDCVEWCPSKRGESNMPFDPETVSIASTSRPTSPSTILARLWQGVGRQTASLFGRRSAPKSKHSSHNKGLSATQPASGVRVTRIGIRRIGSRSRFRSLTTSPVSVTVSGGVAMTDMQADSLASKTLVK